MDDTVDLAEYLFTRLRQIGVGSVHGVPGDYNLASLDHVQRAGLHWVGNANELNAGYAADGYARLKGAGALATSFGVGELSALNAVAGAYAEKVPVVHIVGGPPRAARAARACLHHSLGDGDLGVFAAMYAAVTVAQARLDCPATAPRLVDEVLRACLVESRPVYVELPSDMAAAQVPRPTMPAAIFPSTTSVELYACRAQVLCSMIAEAERPMILVDGFTARFDIREEINELVRISQIPTLTTPFGKGIVNETLPGYKGIFCGAMGNKELQDWVDGCDLVLHFGPLRSDVNTFGFSARTNVSKTLFFEKNAVEHDDSTNLLLLKEVSATKRLVQYTVDIYEACIAVKTYPCPPIRNLPMDLLKELPAPTSSSPVDQQTFWLRVSRLFRPGDIILTETGTASYGGQSFVLPENTILINSSLWLSIGYTLAAAQGAALAQREMFQAGDRPHGRTILFEGEGSLQMSAQAISDMIRNRLDVIIFVINNGGYTIERLIHGFSASYNDVQPWRNLEAPSFFGAPRDDLLESEELFVFAELEGNTGSATTLDTVYAWFSECSSHHQERCKNPPTSTDGWLPTRLLDVGANSASHWKLLISDIDLRGGPAPAYLTLSYRWGTNPQHALWLLSTLDQYRKGSRISDLPQTFQDLVVVARRFGVRYMWIDCFCIIQDCQDDWEAEAPMMRQVYANAACNIAASASDSPEGGLFRSRTIQDIWPGVIVKKSTLGHEESVYCVDSNYWDRNLLTSPLHTRGWVFQERFLGPRQLYFTRDQVLWECLEGHRCKGFPNGVPLYDSPKSIDQLLVRPEGTERVGRLQDQGGNCFREDAMALDVVNQWCDLVTAYSHCHFTNPEDKLYAFSGIAKFFQEITDVTYIAGMWRSRILDLLGWVVTRPKAKPSGAYRAPSWSWASVDGPVDMSKPVLGDVEPLLTVLEVQVSTKREEDKTVGVTGGFIKLRGAFITASYTRDSTRAPRLLQIQLDDGGGTPFSAWPWLDTTEVQFGEGGAFDFLVLHSLKDKMVCIEGPGSSRWSLGIL
ncbi:hypothetical protein VDGE_06729 [Verticillium dahliae]|uniref:Pyruvate decarboxylase n=1 Tax=Verticillium dahliae TaxID=27337 RepID=A0A444RW27_VERDA|nr:hypothetical protein VDGE_06729 [Verticillium dahliae]